MTVTVHLAPWSEGYSLSVHNFQTISGILKSFWIWDIKENMKLCLRWRVKDLIAKKTYGQESPGWIPLFKLVTFSFFENIQKRQFFLVKLIGHWIPNGDGRGIARDIKKKLFNFQNSTKNGNQVGTIYKVGTFSAFQLFKLSKLFYHLLSSFENENISFYFPSNPPPIAVRNSLTNQFHQRFDVSVYFQQQKNYKFK